MTQILHRVSDFAYVVYKEVRARWLRRYNPLRLTARQLFPSIDPHTAKYDMQKHQWYNKPSKQFVVLLHGLNSSPLAWSSYLPHMPEACFVPYVKDKGYCSLKEASQPILEVVQDYATRNPDVQIVLVGHSNGARIAAYLEQRLHASDIRLVSIAGPHLGSKLINLIAKIGMQRLFKITPQMEAELVYGGEWSKKKMRKWQSHADPDVERTFFAAAQDTRVFPSATCFPCLPNSTNHLIRLESHTTIIDGVCPLVTAYIRNLEKA